ncbi:MULTISPECIES: Fic family protein [Hyphomicrobiales]|uniref:Fic family protein n=1 Tax=Hyphomicrobiales TaxID=356 RepID=UPI000622BA8B|nr:MULTISPECIES: Fic family protein [Hyphomicrobiales]CEJ88029.1 putative cAMP-induced filamentation protein [Hyphomicrobium sp. GJ21]
MNVSAMEPLLPDDRQELEDLATDLVAKASTLAGRLHPVMRGSVGDLVRSMNCYYSNLIEGHNTLPIDIDRALHDDFARDPERRNLQLEARAHIEVQRMIDRGEAPSPVLSVDFIVWTHKNFCERLPEELLVAEHPTTKAKIKMVPGELRKDHVKVGAHIPPPPADLPAFLARFAEGYSSKHLSRLRKIIGVAASHHRLAWIHPFLDGNGRVTRLFSHALLRELDVGSELWAVSRGLARLVADYKANLQAADEPRRGDLDGRGNLTMAGLIDFCKFFLTTCVDQVDFMAGLLEPEELLRRMEIWTEEETRAKRLPKGSWPLLREAVMAGEYARGHAPALTGYEERQARTVLNALIEKGYLVSPTTRSPVKLGFPTALVDRWFPRLYQPAV